MEVDVLTSSFSTCFVTLPNELLAHVFSFCGVQDLGRLSVTCKLFNEIIQSKAVWRSLSRNIVIVNQVSEKMKSRCIYEFHEKEKVRLSKQWLKLRVSRVKYPCIRFYNRFMPQVDIEKAWLWYTKGSEFHWKVRARDGSLTHKGGKINVHSDDITRFVISSKHIVTGGRDNKIFIFSKDSKHVLHQIKSAHSREVACLDCNDEILVSAGRDTEVKVYSNFPKLRERYSVFHGDHIWSIAIMANKSILIGAASLKTNIHPLQLNDIERNIKICNLGPYPRSGAGILCICPESNNEVYTGGYDSSVRLWDLRIPNSCVRSWDDPFDSTIVSLASDYNNSFFAGTQRHGFVCLYDKRASHFLKFYYMGIGNSPVYSVTFDAVTLVAALDRGVHLCSYGLY